MYRFQANHFHYNYNFDTLIKALLYSCLIIIPSVICISSTNANRLHFLEDYIDNLLVRWEALTFAYQG